MYSLLRISSPLSESWVFMTYAALLGMAYVATRLTPGIVSVSFNTLFTSKDRDSIFFNGATDFRSNILMTIFCIGIFSMNIYLGIYDGSQFQFLNLLKITALFSLVMVFKDLINRLLCYIFFDNAAYQLIKQQYQRVIIATSVILAPITIVAIYIVPTNPLPVLIMYLAVALFWLTTILIKIFRLFFTKLLAFIYIFLYLCTMEILPMVILIYSTKMIV